MITATKEGTEIKVRFPIVKELGVKVWIQSFIGYDEDKCDLILDYADKNDFSMSGRSTYVFSYEAKPNMFFRVCDGEEKKNFHVDENLDITEVSYNVLKEKAMNFFSPLKVEEGKTRHPRYRSMYVTESKRKPGRFIIVAKKSGIHDCSGHGFLSIGRAMNAIPAIYMRYEKDA